MTTTSSAAHWRHVWEGRDPDGVTWFQADPATSRRLIATVAGLDSAIIDVGAGASRLIDHLLADGYTDVTALDIAPASLAAARQRLGAAADRVTWLIDDVCEARLDRTFDVWHDRAVFHFVVTVPGRDRYLATLRTALAIGGHLVIATFGPDGPQQCSGLPVRRYGIDLMSATLGAGFALVHHELEEHVAPSGVVQQFLYGVYLRTA